MSLKEIFLKLKQKTNSITNNPLLNSFEQEDLEVLDNAALADTFIAEKKKNILNLIKGVKVDFDPKLKSAFDEYNEGLTYLRLKEKFQRVDRVPEGDGKTPDFKIDFTADDNGIETDFTVYAELKSMSFADGNLNYRDAMEQGLQAQIDIEGQIKNGNRVAFGITEIQPLHKDNKKYHPSSAKYAIEILIEKIEQNLKEGQFAFGDTVLIIDLKQITLPSSYIEGGVPVFQEKQYGSLVSGVQWNVAFAKQGHLVYKPIEFEGKENIDGELERNGIFTGRDWIKAIIFLDYSLGERKPKIVGLHKQTGISDGVSFFLNKFCDFVNDDMNTAGWVLNDNAKKVD